MKKIVIVGAGPSGLYLANRLCEKYEVHVFEKMEKEMLLNAHPWTDSVDLETLPILGLPVPIKRGIRFYGDGVKNREDRIGLYEPVKKSSAPRIALDRNALIQTLLEKVEDKVWVHYGCSAIGLVGNTQGSLSEHCVTGIRYEKENERFIQDADLVIDASGCAFALRHAFTSCLGEKVDAQDVFSAYKTMRKLSHQQGISKYRNGELIHSPKGYRWISQLDEDILDVGCCIVSDMKDESAAKKEAEAMILQMDGVEEECFGGGGNVIPMTLPIAALVCDGFASVGENAHMTNPGNGCGISGAIYGAKLLADTIIRKNDFSLTGLWEYAYQWYIDKGAYYASNYFPSHWFTLEECKYLKEHKIISGTLKNVVITRMDENRSYMSKESLLKCKVDNVSLYEKVLHLKDVSEKMDQLLLMYPNVWEEKDFNLWYESFRTIKQSYYEEIEICMEI